MKSLLVIIFSILPLFICGQVNNTITLERIIFNTSMCMGTCPVYHLQVNNDKTILLFTELVYKDNTLVADTSKMGYFAGIVDNTLYGKLMNELQIIGLDSLNIDIGSYVDLPEIRIHIYYNGKHKYLKTNSPSDKADNLVSILYEICQTKNLRRTNRKFIIEN